MPLVENGLVIGHSQLDQDLYELEFIAPKIANECMPGQFVHILPGNTLDPLLRRPISLYDVDKKLGSITLLYKVVGKGTNLLTNIKPKEYVNVMGPLGRGFTLISNQNAVLVGGGVGIAPLIYLARRLKENNCNVTVIHGTERKSQLVAFNKLLEIGVEYLPATMDGTAGYKGLATDLLSKKLDTKEIDFLYTCGPEPMMAIVADYGREKGIMTEVSLEEHMACGVGACLGCARKFG
ncbi:MAG: dihydroorotate dehydrogenase electron transfer subunit, partial [Syntrophomonadaceae bacterium]|nr:dihydroorotate dehydrogenase electron transfer subunit [Syntrophomonadaceae bacterium]